LNVKLPWNVELKIPFEGCTVAEAVERARPTLEHRQYAESHVFLSAGMFDSTQWEYVMMTNYEGRLIHLDGLHRLIAWAISGKKEVKALVAGHFSSPLGEPIESTQLSNVPENPLRLPGEWSTSGQ
jgi:hypothetical protein